MKRITIAKNSAERIEVSITELNGKEYLDVRNYYKADGGEWKPTPKGIMIPVALSRKVQKAIKKLAEPYADMEHEVTEKKSRKKKTDEEKEAKRERKAAKVQRKAQEEVNPLPAKKKKSIQIPDIDLEARAQEIAAEVLKKLMASGDYRAAKSTKKKKKKAEVVSIETARKPHKRPRT